ncbi:MAG: hypothetical protein ACREUY_10780 [Burkholderiales bacterium]
MFTPAQTGDGRDGLFSVKRFRGFILLTFGIKIIICLVFLNHVRARHAVNGRPQRRTVLAVLRMA